MKTYMVFAFEGCFPSGGWGDFYSSYETLEEARRVCEHLETFVDSSVHIVDVRTGEIIYEN